MAFFTAPGFSFNMDFTNQDAACLVIGDDIFAMLLTEPFFKSFIKKEICDSTKSAETIIALSADSKEAADEMVNKALRAGGTPYNPPMTDQPVCTRGVFRILTNTCGRSFT